LQQQQAHQRLIQRDFGCGQAPGRPASLDLAHPFEHHGVVMAMRTSVERQTDANCRNIIGRQKQPVHAKILEPQTLLPDRFKHGVETTLCQQLPRQQMMALHSRIIIGIATPVDLAKTDPGTHEKSA